MPMSSSFRSFASKTTIQRVRKEIHYNPYDTVGSKASICPFTVLPMAHSLQGVGIDVSKASLQVCLFVSSSEQKTLTVQNTKQGISAFIHRIQNFSGKIVMESTGRYHFLSALLLSSAGFDVRVLNPLIPKKYSLASIHNRKTDTADALILARIAVQEPEEDLPKPFTETIEDITVRQNLGFLASLEKKIQSLLLSLQGYEECCTTLGLIESAVVLNIKKLAKEMQKQKGKLEKEIMEYAEKIHTSQEKYLPDAWQKQHKILVSIPGISPFVATMILQFFDIVECKSVKQWIAYAGMNILDRQSGKWRGKGRMSHRGNPYFRKRFFSAAWGAKMSHEKFKSYYDALRERGLSYTESLIVIARKLLSIAFSLLKKDLLFNENISFPS